MKRMVCILLTLLLLTTAAGCGAGTVTEMAEGTKYSLAWCSQRDGSLQVTLDAAIPDGSVWSSSEGGIVSITGPVENKDGSTAYKIAAAEMGSQWIYFYLTEQSTGICSYTLAVQFAVQQQDGSLYVSDYRETEGGAESIIGEGSFAITCLSSVENLQLVLQGSDWEISHENDDFLTEISAAEEATTLCVYRRSSEQVIAEIYSGSTAKETAAEEETSASDTATATDNAEAAAQDERQQKLNEFYAEREDTFVLSSCAADTTYTLTLHMDAGGSITVTHCEQTSYQGDASYQGTQIFYDPNTGETHISHSEDYVGWQEPEESYASPKDYLAAHPEKLLDDTSRQQPVQNATQTTVQRDTTAQEVQP